MYQLTHSYMVCAFQKPFHQNIKESFPLSILLETTNKSLERKTTKRMLNMYAPNKSAQTTTNSLTVMVAVIGITPSASAWTTERTVFLTVFGAVRTAPFLSTSQIRLSGNRPNKLQRSIFRQSLRWRT